MTPFAVTVMFVLTSLNNVGQLAPLSKDEWTALGIGGPAFFDGSQCLVTRGRLAHPEKYVCQRFTSAPSIKWEPPSHATDDRNGGMVDNEVGDGVAHKADTTYSLKYWDDGWNVGTPGLTLKDCEEARKNFHLRGAALERWDRDKNRKKHLPYCEEERLHNVDTWAKGSERFPDQGSCLKTSSNAERKAGIECHPIAREQELTK
jgi:hypothetical protein